MTVYHYDDVIVWQLDPTSYVKGAAGLSLGPWTTLAGDPVTITQGGKTVSRLVSDGNGRVSFTADAIAVTNGTLKLYSIEWGQGAGDAATAVATANDAKTLAVEAKAAADEAQDAALAALHPALDISQRPPEFVLELYPQTLRRTVQSTVKDTVTGEWFVTQVDPDNPGDGIHESAVVSRCAPDGRFLDVMFLTSAGHGTKFGIQNIDDGTGNLVPHLWWGWAGASAGGSGNDLVRFPYAAGATIDRDDPSIEVMPTFGVTSVPQVGVDQGLDLLCVRWISGEPGLDVYTLRSVTDVVAGYDAPLGTVRLSSATTVQGFAFDADRFYLYTGASDSETQLVEAFDWSTGDQVASVNVADVDVRPGESHEPESAQIFTDPASGTSSLFVGIVGGVSGRRVCRMYAFTPPGGPDYSTVSVARSVANLPVVQAGQSRIPPNTTTDLTALTTPGWYYLPVEVVAQIVATDWPSGLGKASSWWLNVSGLGGDPGTGPFLAQQLIRVSGATTRPQIYYRVINLGGGTKGLWEQVSTTQVPYGT